MRYILSSSRVWVISYQVLEFLEEIKSVASNEYGFFPNTSHQNQLLYISSDIYVHFGKLHHLKQIKMFWTFKKHLTGFDISDCYTKFEILQILGNLLSLFQGFLCNRFQRLVIRSDYSSWKSVQVAFPQGSILVLFVFMKPIISFVLICNKQL